MQNPILVGVDTPASNNSAFSSQVEKQLAYKLLDTVSLRSFESIGVELGIFI